MRFSMIVGYLLLFSSSRLLAAELVVLSESNWDEYAVVGKEADCIYGDLVLRNDRITAVIAAPVATRNANMTVRNVGWAIIDLTQRTAPNDQLSAFYPDSLRHAYTSGQGIIYQVDGKEAQPLDPQQPVTGHAITVTCTSDPVVGRPDVAVRYTLSDGDPFVLIETVYKNSGDNLYAAELSDTVRADTTFQFGVDPATNSFWADDDWFRETYGVICPDYTVAYQGDRGVVIQYKKDNVAQISVERGEKTFARKLIPAASLLEYRGLAAAITGAKVEQASLTISDGRGPVSQARIELKQSVVSFGTGRTDPNGKISFPIASGEYEATITAPGREQSTHKLSLLNSRQKWNVKIKAGGLVVTNITDAAGQPIPCKVQFQGLDGTPDPEFGPTTTVPVKNVCYSHNGQIRQEMTPGKYRVIVSHGPEYDAVIRDMEVFSDRDTPFDAELTRSVDTSGWVSADFHSHSSPSGDNTCDQRARVLGLLCENIEFAPCTEHNRVDTYDPHLEALQVKHLMATCSGMELTGQPLPLNHQNAFPLHRKPRTQDGGAPVTDENPIVQIKRLALWEHDSEKLVQINHPNLVQMIGDRDEDGMPDGGFAEMFGFADVIEVHPLQPVLLRPGTEEFNASRNTTFHWMQMLNLGYRHTGVVNTDAHYSFHESGGLRNFIRCSTDDPSQIDTMEMVRNATAGKLVMSNGPFMTVEAKAEQKTAGPGENLVLSSEEVQLHIRVQCPNWLDINRVVVFVNGRPDEPTDFSRQGSASKFSDGVVKFDAEFPVMLKGDSHLIVVAAGEGLTVGPVMGPSWGKQVPIAVSNPIFVDVNSDGFHANGDMLDAPLPIEKTTLPAR